MTLVTAPSRGNRLSTIPPDIVRSTVLPQLRQAAEVIGEGGVVAYPTESCFGLGCDPDNVTAIKRILEIKRRSRNKGLILIADRFARFRKYLEDIEPAVQQAALASWPGPTTWLWPARPATSPWLIGDHDTLGVRVTNHWIAAKLSQLGASALVSTSANRAGQKMLRTSRQVAQEFNGEVDFIVNASIGSMTAPSRIVDCRSGDILRP